MKLFSLSFLCLVFQACSWAKTSQRSEVDSASFVSEISESAKAQSFSVSAWGTLDGNQQWIEVLHEGQVGIIFSQPLSSDQLRSLKKANRENERNSWRARSSWDYFTLKPGQLSKDESNRWMFSFKNPMDQEITVLLMYRSFSPFDNGYGQPKWVVQGLEEYLGAKVQLEQAFE